MEYTFANIGNLCQLFKYWYVRKLHSFLSNFSMTGGDNSLYLFIMPNEVDIVKQEMDRLDDEW